MRRGDDGREHDRHGRVASVAERPARHRGRAEVPSAARAPMRPGFLVDQTPACERSDQSERGRKVQRTARRLGEDADEVAPVPADVRHLPQVRPEDLPAMVIDEHLRVVDDPMPRLPQRQADLCVLAAVEARVPAADRAQLLGPNEEVVGREVVDVASRSERGEAEAKPTAPERRLVERPPARSRQPLPGGVTPGPPTAAIDGSANRSTARSIQPWAG